MRASRRRPFEVAKLVRVDDRAHRSVAVAAVRKDCASSSRRGRGRLGAGAPPRPALPTWSQSPLAKPSRQLGYRSCKPSSRCGLRVRGTPHIGHHDRHRLTGGEAGQPAGDMPRWLGADRGWPAPAATPHGRRLVVHDVVDARLAVLDRNGGRGPRRPRCGCATRRHCRRRSPGTVAGGSALPWPHRPPPCRFRSPAEVAVAQHETLAPTRSSSPPAPGGGSPPGPAAAPSRAGRDRADRPRSARAGPCRPTANPCSSAPRSAVPPRRARRPADGRFASMRSRLVTAKKRSGCRMSFAERAPDSAVSWWHDHLGLGRAHRRRHRVRVERVGDDRVRPQRPQRILLRRGSWSWPRPGGRRPPDRGAAARPEHPKFRQRKPSWRLLRPRVTN